MIYIVGIIIALVLFSFIADHLGEVGIIIAALIILIIAFLAASWLGVLITIGVVGGGLFISSQIHSHDESKKAQAIANLETQRSKEAHDNEVALRSELDLNCRWLGFMNSKMWQSNLPNFAQKNYETSFDEITKKFAEQIEQQMITQNKDWFQPFINYILNHQSGSTVVKMLNEVDCPSLKATHVTPNKNLVEDELKRGCTQQSKDVPPIFDVTPLQSGDLYTPTRYLLHREGLDTAKNESSSGNAAGTVELSFDDL